MLLVLKNTSVKRSSHKLTMSFFLPPMANLKSASSSWLKAAWLTWVAVQATLPM